MTNPTDEILALARQLATARVRRAIVGRGLAPTSNETPAGTESRTQRAEAKLRAYLDTLDIKVKSCPPTQP